MTCKRCGQPILKGQSYIVYRTLLGHYAERHIACPTARQIRRARLWGRWA